MKTLKWMFLVLLLSFVFLPLAADAEEEGVVKLIAEHKAQEASYEEKVKAQDDLIAEHTQMKQGYKQKYFVNEKVTPMSRIRDMETHCNKIIAGANSLKNELLEFAKWHRMRAAELQGK